MQVQSSQYFPMFGHFQQGLGQFWAKKRLILALNCRF